MRQNFNFSHHAFLIELIKTYKANEFINLSAHQPTKLQGFQVFEFSTFKRIGYAAIHAARCKIFGGAR